MKEEMKGFIKLLKNFSQLQIQETILFLEFIDYTIDPPRYSIEECIKEVLTFKVPLKVKLNFIVLIQIMKILKLSFKMFISVIFLYDS